MSFNIPRTPNDMDKKEVFDTIQQLQKAAESLGQQYTMYTKTTLPKGKQPTVDDMHEEAARQQLTALYNSQNKAPTTKPEGQQVAQNLAGAGVKGIGIFGGLADIAGMITGTQKEINQYDYNEGYYQGSQGKIRSKDYTPNATNPASWWKGYNEGKAKWEAQQEQNQK